MSKHTRHNTPKNKNTHSKLGRMKNQGWGIYKMDIKLRDKYLDSWNQNDISCVIIIVITKKKKKWLQQNSENRGWVADDKWK